MEDHTRKCLLPNRPNTGDINMNVYFVYGITLNFFLCVVLRRAINTTDINRAILHLAVKNDLVRTVPKETIGGRRNLSTYKFEDITIFLLIRYYYIISLVNMIYMLQKVKNIDPCTGDKAHAETRTPS